MIYDYFYLNFVTQGDLESYMGTTFIKLLSRYSADKHKLQKHKYFSD